MAHTIRLLNSRTNLWRRGTIDDCKFWAKVYMIGSHFGIMNGKVSKLSIINNTKTEIFNYDRSFDFTKDNGMELALAIVNRFNKTNLKELNLLTAQSGKESLRDKE